MNRCDALIVGGGPAGLTAAIALRLRGIDVIVADALKPPIDKACGEGLMPDALRDLQTLGVALKPTDGGTFSGIRFVNHRKGQAVAAAAKFTNGKGFGVRRQLLHSRLLERAEELGVRFCWKTRVVLGGEVMLDGENCTFRYLIGADGQASKVRSLAGLDAGRVISRRFGFRRHFSIAPWSEFVEVHCCPIGQAYVTPVSDSEICIAAVTRAPNLRLAHVIDAVPFLRQKLRDVQPLDAERGAITATRRLDCVARENIALVGDASGSVDAITGEGMAASFRQSILLADAIEKDDVSIYAAGHQGTLSRAQWMARAMLFLDAHPLARQAAVGTLNRCPSLFQMLLNLHIRSETSEQQGAQSDRSRTLPPLASKHGWL